MLVSLRRATVVQADTDMTGGSMQDKIALEEQDKVMLNSIAESGSCISQISHSNPIAQARHLPGIADCG